MSRKIFLNLPVADLAQSINFWGKLGFEFNPQFTDINAACMVISDEAFVMLLTKPFFQTFTKRPIADAKSATQALFALSCSSREDVNAIVNEAVASGGKHAMPAQDHGFMYAWSFYDLDDHHWEVMWMDPNHIQGNG